MVRVALIVALSAVLGACSVDGGLLDPDSTLSQRQRSERDGVARAVEIEGASAATQATMLAFYGSVCSLQSRYRTDLAAADRDAGELTPAQYRDTAASVLGTRATAAERARDAASRLPIPNLFPDEWRTAQDELVGLFTGLERADRSSAADMAAADLADTDQLQTVARELLAASAQRIEDENPRVRAIAQGLPASRQVRGAAAELAECRTQS